MNRKKLILVLSCILVLIIGGLAVFFMLDSADKDSNKQMYRKKMSAASKYVENEQWDDAIVAYKEAIKYDDKDEEAYMMLAQIYIYQGMTDEAEDILLQGIEKTSSQMLQDMYDEYFGKTKTEKKESSSEEGIELNSSLLKQISTYKIEDYTKKYGYASYKVKSSSCDVSHNNLKDVSFTYKNSNNSGDVLDNSTGKPKNGKMPTSASFDDLGVLFSGADGEIKYEQLQKLGLKNFRRDRDASVGLDVVIFEANNCVVEIETDKDGNIEDMSAWNMVTPKELNNEDEGDKHEITGTIVSALTGNGVSDATLYVRDRGVTTGDPIAEITTDRNGGYTVELEQGEYTAEVNRDGYIPENIDFEVDGWGEIDIEQFVISEELEDGEIRIVLEWGEYPRDLDSHLEGRTSSGQNIHVFFANKEEDGANLDVDDTSSYGPETITITDINGEYNYYVYDFTESGNIGISGATVKVYTPGSFAPKTYSVPAITGNTWEVFSIKNGQVVD